MKPVLSVLFAGVLAVGSLALAGCSSNSEPTAKTPDQQGSTAGGNGEFGTTPARPGSHQGDSYNQESNGQPTTRPANGF